VGRRPISIPVPTTGSMATDRVDIKTTTCVDNAHGVRLIGEIFQTEEGLTEGLDCREGRDGEGLTSI
jgi:hypothetical protein